MLAGRLHQQGRCHAPHAPTACPLSVPHIARKPLGASRSTATKIHASQSHSQQAESSSQQRQPATSAFSRFPAILSNRNSIPGTSCASAFVLVPSLGGFGGFGNNSSNNGGGGRGGGGGGGGGGEGNGFQSSSAQHLYDIAADDDSSDDADLKKRLLTDSEEQEGSPGERSGTPRCVEIVIEGWPDASILPTKEELKDMLTVQEGHVFEYQDLVDDRVNLQTKFDDYINKVEVIAEYVDDKTNYQKVIYRFSPHFYRGIEKIEVKGSTIMPKEAIERICQECLTGKGPYQVDISVMDKVRNKIEEWHKNNGLPFCYVGFFDGTEDAILRANVTEAKISSVAVRFAFPRATSKDEGVEVEYRDRGTVATADQIIKASGFKVGNHYQVEDGFDAMNSIYASGVFQDINIEPEQDPQDVNKIIVKIKVEEVQKKRMEMDLDWSFQLKNGIPQLTRQSLIPGGSVEVTRNNLFGNAESATLSLSSSDWRNPTADLGFQLSYSEPFHAPNTIRNAQIFNTRKYSSVFTPGAEAEVPPVFVDRFGIKGWTVSHGANSNKVEHALLLQQIATFDEQGQPVLKGTKVQRGYYADNGPPTTLSKMGKDLSLSYQGYAVLDDVQFINGHQLGKRATFQVDQGLNVGVPLPGKKWFGFSGGLFNRCAASYTAFLPMNKLSEEQLFTERKAFNTVVLHAKAGNAIGDVGSYDYYSLGGPYSVRGYNYGEIGAARRFVELSAEARFPLKNYGLPGTVYGFADYASDLNSSKTLTGNPTEYYRKPGRGMSYGVGVKALGACRFEYARDCNSGTGALLVNFGERF